MAPLLRFDTYSNIKASYSAGGHVRNLHPTSRSTYTDNRGATRSSVDVGRLGTPLHCCRFGPYPALSVCLQVSTRFPKQPALCTSERTFEVNRFQTVGPISERYEVGLRRFLFGGQNRLARMVWMEFKPSFPSSVCSLFTVDSRRVRDVALRNFRNFAAMFPDNHVLQMGPQEPGQAMGNRVIARSNVSPQSRGSRLL